MKIVYCSNVCSEETYKKIFAESKLKPGQQVQKYHRTLLKGISSNSDVRVDAISKLSVQRENCKRTWVCGFEENWNRATIRYMPVCNLPKVGQFAQIIFSFFYMLKEKKEKDTVALLDVLNISMGMGIAFACRLRRIKLIGIITDLPEMLSEAPDSKFVKLCYKIIDCCDGYLLLTKEMNSRTNLKNKPYVVIEGQVDQSILTEDIDTKKYEKKVCLYSGSLNRIHGIPYLVEGFLKANITDTELHIYGNGDYENELISVAKKNMNVKYFGVKLNDEVVAAQKKSTLLINPRPTDQEFVKYSFPSKNMEYMASGTPMLTTRLPGMPKEYYPHVFILDEENADGMAKKLAEILSLDSEELQKKGMNARNFVLNHKTGKVQAEKIQKLANYLVKRT